MPISLAGIGAAGLGIGSAIGSIRSAIARRAVPAVGGMLPSRGTVGRIGGLVGPIAGGALGGYLARPGEAGYPRRRRARGITAAELRGARKVAALVRMYGMRPKAGRIGGRKRCR